PRLRRCFPGSQVTHAEAAYAVREEKALRMSDVVFRRTELGTAGHPGTPALLGPCKLVPEQRLQLEQRWSARVSGRAELSPPEHDIAHAQSLLLTHRICGFRMGNLTAGKTSTQPWLVLRSDNTRAVLLP